MQGFSWVLIVVTVIVAALAVLSAVYLLVYYQHLEDKNQASRCEFPAFDGYPAFSYCLAHEDNQGSGHHLWTGG